MRKLKNRGGFIFIFSLVTHGCLRFIEPVESREQIESSAKSYNEVTSERDWMISIKSDCPRVYERTERDVLRRKPNR